MKKMTELRMANSRDLLSSQPPASTKHLPEPAKRSDQLNCDVVSAATTTSHMLLGLVLWWSAMAFADLGFDLAKNQCGNYIAPINRRCFVLEIHRISGQSNQLEDPLIGPLVGALL